MSFGTPLTQQLTASMNNIVTNQSLGTGNPQTSALLPTPTLQMPVPMPTCPPPLMPGMIPVAVIGSAAPVPFIATSTAPMITTNMPDSSLSVPGTNSKQSQKKIGKFPETDASGVATTTTVFVGNITEHASDSLVRQTLMKCGAISSWKRVQGASGKLQAFGFCEYSSPEAALRAMRLLNGFQLGDKTLLVKVDGKTRAQLDDYKKKIKEEREDEDAGISGYDVELDDATRKEDEYCLDEIKELINCNSAVLAGTYDESLPYMKRSHSGCAENLEGLDMDNAKKDLVSKEIRSFRQTYRQLTDWLALFGNFSFHFQWCYAFDHYLRFQDIYLFHA